MSMIGETRRRTRRRGGQNDGEPRSGVVLVEKRVLETRDES
jgi:hypothetical protein